MSGGAIYQEVLRLLRRHELPEQAERDVLVALEAGQPGPLALLYEAGAEAGLGREARLLRGAGIFLSFCAGNLADDVIDGDCTYYAEPTRVAPYVQFTLQNLAWATLARAELSAEVLAEAAAALVRAAGPQALEVRTREWRAPVYWQVAEGIAGQQWAAYLKLLWAGTAFAGHAAAVGRGLGVAAHVAEDIRTKDPRFFLMPVAEQREVLRQARAAADEVRRRGLRCLEAALRRIDPILVEGAP
jgi:hypothetical protein